MSFCADTGTKNVLRNPMKARIKNAMIESTNTAESLDLILNQAFEHVSSPYQIGRRRPSRQLGTTHKAWILMVVGIVLLGPALGCKQKADPVSDSIMEARTLTSEAKQHMLVGDTEKALELLDQAVNLRPQDPLIRLDQADALAMLGRHASALETYRTAATLAREAEFTGGLPEAHLGAALVNQNIGDTNAFHAKLDVAETGFRARMDNPPGLSERDRRDARIEAEAHVAYITFLRGDRSAAMGQAAELFSKHPENPRVRDILTAMNFNFDGRELPSQR